MDYTIDGDRSLLDRLDQGKFNTFAKQALEGELAQGKAQMVNNIETRGTGKTWHHAWKPSGRTGSTPGRDDTGLMKRSVDGPETVTALPNGATGFLGWPEGSPEYFRHQENGFRNVLIQVDVEEMHALRDAADETTTEVIQSVQAYARK